MSEYRKVDVKKVGDECVMLVEKVFFNPKTDTHKYPDFTFQGRGKDGPVMVYMPENSCRRQFGRSPLTMEPEAAIGATFRFYRDLNKDDAAKPYWAVDMLSPADTQPTPSKRLTGPTAVPGDAPPSNRDIPFPTDHDAPPAEDYYSGPAMNALPPAPPAAGQPDGKDAQRQAVWEKIGAAYGWALNAAYIRQTAVASEAGDAPITPTMETVQAGAATLLIAADKMGAIR
jgi:hypothetical protein